MMKVLLKIWPGLLVLLLYWLFMVLKNRKRSNIIEAEYEVLEEKPKKNIKKGVFCFENDVFVGVIYVSLLLIIFSLIALVAFD